MLFLRLWVKKKIFWPNIPYVFIFTLALGVFVFWGKNPVFPDPDAFYHAGMARVFLEKGVMKEFPWLQFTTLKDTYTDQHFLFHIFLIPGVFFAGLWGAKVTGIFFSSLCILVFVLVLKKLGVRFAWLWGMLLLFTIPWSFRLGLLKSNALSLIILFVGIFLAQKKHYKSLFLLSFLYVWTYGAFPLLLLFGRRLKGFFTIALGLLVGLIINPYFPQNFLFYKEQLIDIGIVNYQKIIGVGGEWYPYPFADLLTGSALLTFFLILSVILMLRKKPEAFTLWTFVWFIFFLALTLKSRRYVEYYPPFAWLFVGQVFTAFLNTRFKGERRFLDEKWQRIFPSLNASLTRSGEIIATFYDFRWRMMGILAGSFFALTFFGIMMQDFRTNMRDLQKGFSFDRFQKSSAWLEEHAVEGSIVLHSDWDDFPLLFWHNRKNLYIVGLDPTFMYTYDAQKYSQWADITLGREVADLEKVLKEDFRASYVMVEKDHYGMDRSMRNIQLQKVYEDEEVRIYQI